MAKQNGLTKKVHVAYQRERASGGILHGVRNSYSCRQRTVTHPAPGSIGGFTASIKLENLNGG